MTENFYTREGGRYFAFVEAIDALDDKAMKNREGLPEYWPDILSLRDAADLKHPTHRIWLDCVRRDYFLNLEWLHEPCRRDQLEDANRRRQRLLDMDVDQFAVVLLLFNSEDAAGNIEQFREGSWHDIALNPSSGLPVVAAPDFDLVEARPCYIQGHEAAQANRHLLQNVFNLDFLPDADLGGRGGTPSWPYGEPPLEHFGKYLPNVVGETP